ncbi:hypothetical protein [Catenovulum agarivorans]|uniref:hypothetical protein n=1 Tax=Catenovulum agarivorans TaxID=1172192 RepID=UPI0002F7008B|nr:hypothetical protein [Catenovulum agarivorans]
MTKLAVVIITSLFLFACANTQKQDYQLVYPQAADAKWLKAEQKQASGIRLEYEKDHNGKRVIHKLTKQVTVYGTEFDSMATLKQRAKEKAAQEATEEINGVVIRSTSKIDSTRITSSNGQFSHQEFEENALIETAGIAQVRNVSCKTEDNNAQVIKLLCKMDVLVPKIKSASIM